MIELEKTYLVKYIPEGLEKCKSSELLDVYFPSASLHPKLRLRKKGDKFEMTKKTLIDESDAGAQIEETINLTEEEFEELQEVSGKRVRKIRYYLDHENNQAEIDVFQDDLNGLVLVDFEFKSKQEKDDFIAPDFCLTEVTQEEFVAGGMLCGKSYADIEKYLVKFDYKKL